MEYRHTPKVVVIAGAPAAGKSTAAQKLRDDYGYALLSLDAVNVEVRESLGIDVEELRQPRTEIFSAFRSCFGKLVRARRFQNLVIEGARISHPHIFEAFRAAVVMAYSEYTFFKFFYLNPDREQRYEQYLLRQARLAKEAAKLGGEQGKRKLEVLKNEVKKGFCDYLEPVLPGFDVVESSDDIFGWAGKHADAVHPSLNEEHMDLIRFIAESGAPNPFYQTIEVGGKTVVQGFTDSVRSWENILEMEMDFSGKTLCDIGCMHGYYSFKCEEKGAIPTGYDVAASSIAICNEVARYRNSVSTFEVCDVTKGLGRDFDMVMALNVLHRVSDMQAALKHIFEGSKEFLFEAGKKQLAEITETGKEHGFKLIRTHGSHRNSDVVGQRILAYMAKE